MIQRDHGVYKPTTTETPMRERIARAILDGNCRGDHTQTIADAVLDAMREPIEHRVNEYKHETEMAYADLHDAITALRFYAESANYTSGDINLDRGNLARSALAAIDAAKEGK